jgi:signal transduction histidine kinase
MTFSMALFALVAAAAFGAICAVAGALWMKARAAQALREAMRDREQLLDLAEAWIWRTDADQRVTLWRPPAGRPTAWREPPPLGQRLAEIAVPTDLAKPASAASTTLARQMTARARISEQRIALRLGGVTRIWSLRGEPCHDGAGRFIGYVGNALPLGDSEAAGFGRAALAQVLPHSEAGLMLFERADVSSPWLLQAYAPGAVPLFSPLNHGEPADNPGRGGKPGNPEPLDWATACARLPAPVAKALAEMASGETRVVGEWSVSWSAIGAPDDAQAGRLFVVRPSAPAVAAQAPQDTADQESFVYSVSHDLRAPIRVVEGFARILKEDYGRFLDRIGNDHTDRILAAAARMNSMIDALLALSRLQSQPLKRQPVDLSQLANYILEDLRSETPERAVEVDIEPGLVVVGDPTLMRIAIENLVGNAWKYSAKMPVTRVALRREPHEGCPAYVISDNGAGFDMRFADRLFGVFQRLHSAKDFQGTGVGLASVRRIIRRHGGDIWADSEVGKGARFHFTLP